MSWSCAIEFVSINLGYFNNVLSITKSGKEYWVIFTVSQHFTVKSYVQVYSCYANNAMHMVKKNKTWK